MDWGGLGRDNAGFGRAGPQRQDGAMAVAGPEQGRVAGSADRGASAAGRRVRWWAAVALPTACSAASVAVAVLLARSQAASFPGLPGAWWAALGAYAFAGGVFAGLAVGALMFRGRTGSTTEGGRGARRDE